MKDTSRTPDEIVAYYKQGLERDRLATGVGALELARTLQLLERVLPAPPSTIADIGGGPGRYALWLMDRGYRVHLVDPVPLHIDQAREAVPLEHRPLFASADVGDARDLTLPDECADAVLLLGPLYHLPEPADRLQALGEAKRICRAGGVVIAATISRFASTLDGLRGGYLEDPAFAAVAVSDRRDGRHHNPTGNPAYFTTAYFHHPDEIAAECTEAGLTHEATFAIEGPAWLLADIEERLADERRRAALFDALAGIESERSLLGVSAHLLTVARKA